MIYIHNKYGLANVSPYFFIPLFKIKSQAKPGSKELINLSMR